MVAKVEQTSTQRKIDSISGVSTHGTQTRFYRAMLCIARLLPACGVRLSVRPSVTFVSCANTIKDIFDFFSPSGSQAILVIPYQTGWRYSDGNPPNGGVECKGV